MTAAAAGAPPCQWHHCCCCCCHRCLPPLSNNRCRMLLLLPPLWQLQAPLASSRSRQHWHLCCCCRRLVRYSLAQVAGYPLQCPVHQPLVILAKPSGDAAGFGEASDNQVNIAVPSGEAVDKAAKGLHSDARCALKAAFGGSSNTAQHRRHTNSRVGI